MRKAQIVAEYLPAPQEECVAIDLLVPYARNARTHSQAQVAQIAASIDEYGYTNTVLWDDKGIIAGHGRVLGARYLYDAGKTMRHPNGAPIPPGTIPAKRCDGWSEGQRKAYVLADNQLALQAGWNAELLALEIADLQDLGFNLELTGFDDAAIADLLNSSGVDGGAGEGGKSGAGSLAERFGVPPFSVLNAREGWWQNRKAAWLALGIRSEIGRGEGDRACPGGSPMVGNGDGGLAFGQVNFESGAPASGTSIFDPVLCELAYRWFCAPGGLVLDPFAGGSVRGIVAAKLGREYVGVDLRPEQVEANRAQADVICADGVAPAWTQGDSAAVIPSLDVAADLVFSCPPYGDLEVYSDLGADLSTMEHEAFITAYRAIIAAAVAKLKPDRFACFVVGDFRDGAGYYRNFVSDTIGAFEDAGAKLYNEAILVTACGSLPIRAAKQFDTTRKLGKTHQNVLVFCKGDPRKATEAIGPVEFGEIDAPADGVEIAPGVTAL